LASSEYLREIRVLGNVMKTKALFLTMSLAVAGTGAAHAQMFQPTQVRDAALGAVAGALIGGHNNDHWAEGAALGAAAGLVVGSTVDRPNARLDAPTTGALLGALAGGVIGNHNGRNGAVGAVIGAVAGYGLGSAVQSTPSTRPAPYDEPPAMIEDARTVPDAPRVGEEPRVVYVERPAPPAVVYVERPAPVRVIRVIESPRVVYAPSYRDCAPRPIIIERPAFRGSYGWRSGRDCGPVHISPRHHHRRW
jgi:uncharacterized membrane protein